MAIEKLTLHHVEGPRAGQSDSFRAGIVTVGRSPDTTLAFATERGVSSRHAEIRIDAERIELVDNNSTNGTFVNDERVTQRELKPGDLVRFGYMGPVVRIDYAAAAAPAPPPVAPPRPVAAASTMFIDEAQLAATRAEAAASAPAPAPVPRPAPAAPRPVAAAAYPQAADVVSAQPVRPPVRPAVPAARPGAAAMAAVSSGGGQVKFVLIGVGIAFVLALLLVLAGRALIGG
jgi:predicted component of type VI protein secretion system